MAYYVTIRFDMDTDSFFMSCRGKMAGLNKI